MTALQLKFVREIRTDGTFCGPWQGRRQKLMTTNLSVLVVDDDDALRGIVSTLLKTEGYSPVGVTNGQEGLEALKRQPVDVILTDILMPQKDGLEFIEEVRERLPFVPIVAFSGGGHWLKQEYCMKAAKSLGANVVIRKPFDRQALLDAIDEAISPSEDETRRLNQLLLARNTSGRAHHRFAR
jgi:CheY-like chemotaxis protein